MNRSTVTIIVAVAVLCGGVGYFAGLSKKNEPQVVFDDARNDLKTFDELRRKLEAAKPGEVANDRAVAARLAHAFDPEAPGFTIIDAGDAWIVISHMKLPGAAGGTAHFLLSKRDGRVIGAFTTV